MIFKTKRLLIKSYDHKDADVIYPVVRKGIAVCQEILHLGK